jgi:trans-aconitate 2-methyltransferase
MGEYVLLLEEQGFRVNYATLFERPTPLTDQTVGMQNWLKMFTQNWLTNFSEAEKQDIYQKVEEQLKPLLYRENTWFADYVRLRIMAYR